ncbi:hypothetical protein [Amorphus sp. MBR-141]
MGLAIASATVAENGSLNGAHNIKSCEHKAKGMYVVHYADGFAAGSGAQATPWGAGHTIGLNIMAENMCEVLITDVHGNTSDAGFSFVAFGSD